MWDLVLLGVACVSTATGDVRVSNARELQRALREASPGTRVLVAPGEYEAVHVANVRGEESRPIVVTAADPASRPVFRGGLGFSDVGFLELERLIVERAGGNGVNIDDGGTFETPSHHVVVRELVIRDIGGRANHDALKLSGVEDFRVEGSTFERWGRGGSAIDMVGCRRGVITACTFRDREDDPAASGVQAKGGSREIVVRDSRFEHAGQRAVNLGGSTGLAYFRPKPEGFEARDVTVEGNTIVGSLAPIAFVGVDGATVRFNTFHRPRKWLLRILQETRGPDFVPCRRGVFTDNLIAYRSDEVSTIANVGDATAPDTFEFARNYWFCIDEPRREPPRLPVAERAARGGEDPRFVDAERGELSLAEDSPARAHGADASPRKRR
ncbi:MAG: right-handed parallel beta-helix repeat-containing protein [Planctomycetes bacterium]|nr:right-handed parallel beta-helix repeat-containing protein [Planctomycetota bacterium]